MNSFISMAPEQRVTVCDQTAGQLGLVASSVEKDFWVSWTLRELFHLPGWGEHLTFKGGTSLSKGWKLIERFSEDIDIVIGRDVLGFDGKDSPDQAPSKKQTRKRLGALKAASQEYVQGPIQSALRTVIEESIPETLEWTLEVDPNDNDSQTLLFEHPTVYPDPNAYLQRRVKIEMGARSDTDPSEEIHIQPLIAETFSNVLPDSTFPVRAVSPVRTFWEKAMLLHEETCRPLPKEPGGEGNPKKRKGPKTGMARHYYDLFRLIKKNVADKAISDLKLFERIAEHREIYFNWGWMDYETLRPGSLQLVPPEHYMSDWRNDYNNMQKEMFYGDVPDFDQVLRKVKHFQNRFNEQA